MSKSHDHLLLVLDIHLGMVVTLPFIRQETCHAVVLGVTVISKHGSIHLK